MLLYGVYLLFTFPTDPPTRHHHPHPPAAAEEQRQAARSCSLWTHHPRGGGALFRWELNEYMTCALSLVAAIQSSRGKLTYDRVTTCPRRMNKDYLTECVVFSVSAW